MLGDACCDVFYVGFSVLQNQFFLCVFKELLLVGLGRVFDLQLVE
jgi:hypothetical protein